MTEETKSASTPIDDYRVVSNIKKAIEERWGEIDFGMPGHSPKDVLEDFRLLADGGIQMLGGATELTAPAVDWKRVFSTSVVDATSLAGLVDEPIPYVVKPILVRGSLTQLQGVPKGGKSAFSVYLSLCAATGMWPNPQYLVGVDGVPLKVVYITWEDPEIMMAKRLSLYASGLGLQRTFMPEGLQFLFGPDIFIERGDHVAALRACIKELSPDIIVVDTLSHIHLCEENASSEMKVPMKNLARVAKEENVAIMYLHHTAKSSGDRLTQDKGRGSGAIAAAWHVLIDWGVREKGSHINPVEVQSKYEHKFKYWNIAYEAIENDIGEVESVSWVIDSEDKITKPKEAGSKDKKRARILDTFKNLHKTAEWVTCLQVTNTCNLGLDPKSVQRHLRDLCVDGLLESKTVSANPADPLYYRLRPSNVVPSLTDFQ